jgi:hypothetical protein
MPVQEITANDWIDNNTLIDFRPDPTPLVDDKNTPMIAPDFNPEPTLPPVQPTVQPELVAQPEPEDEDEPIAITTDEGFHMTLEKTKKGWKGAIDIGTGAVQNFYGKTKDELVTNLLKAQANATKKIREQNRVIKLGANDNFEPVRKMDTPVGRNPTPEEVDEIKILQVTDPVAAYEKLHLIKTGRTLEQDAQRSAALERKTLEQDMALAAREFVSRNPDYYADPKFENYDLILGWLSKHKLRRKLTPETKADIEYTLLSNGQFTVDTLEEAFTDLKEDGLLLAAPRPQRAPAPEPPVVPATEQRIVRTETRPRAGYGIRQSETTQTPVSSTPSSESVNFAELSSQEIDRLYKESLALAQRSRAQNR